MQNWFFVQSAEYGKYYIEVDVNGYGTYKIWIGMLHSDDSVGNPVDELTTSNKSSARRKYNKFIQDAETDSYGWNSHIDNLTWEFNTNTSLNSVQEYILSNPKNINVSSYIRRGSNMKKYVNASSDSSIRQKVRNLILDLKNPDKWDYTGYVTLDVVDGKRWAIVIGWLDGFEDEGTADYKRDDCRLCGKVAYQSTHSVMQEYDYDWLMPYDEDTGEVWDTDTSINSDDNIDSCIDWWLSEWEEIKKIYVYPEEFYEDSDAEIDLMNDESETDGIWESTNIRGRKKIMSASSGIRKMTQKQIKDYVRDGAAIDITNYGFGEMDQFLREHNLDKIAVSRGVYGMNGCLLQDRDTGELYAITARNSALMMAF